jgi:hypothetical protein
MARVACDSPPDPPDDFKEKDRAAFSPSARYRKSVAYTEACHLIRLGARTGPVARLTGLGKSVIDRLYHQYHGRSSPSGQTPFSETWYQENDQRLLQAGVIWQLYRHFAQPGQRPARVLIDVYETYGQLIPEPLLTITRAAFVPSLVAMGLWYERACGLCHTPYATTSADSQVDCPGCRLYYRYRCRQCGGVLPLYRGGRRRERCAHCQYGDNE